MSKSLKTGLTIVFLPLLSAKLVLDFFFVFVGLTLGLLRNTLNILYSILYLNAGFLVLPFMGILFYLVGYTIRKNSSFPFEFKVDNKISTSKFYNVISEFLYFSYAFSFGYFILSSVIKLGINLPQSIFPSKDLITMNQLIYYVHDSNFFAIGLGLFIFVISITFIVLELVLNFLADTLLSSTRFKKSVKKLATPVASLVSIASYVLILVLLNYNREYYELTINTLLDYVVVGPLAYFFYSIVRGSRFVSLVSMWLSGESKKNKHYMELITSYINLPID